MNLSSLLALVKEIPAYRALINALADSEPQLPEQPLELLSAARPTVLAALHAHTRRPILVVVARADRARELARQIRAWSPHPNAVLRLPDPDTLPYERVAWGRDTVRERVSALARLTNNVPAGDPPPLVITSTRALMQKTAPPTELQAALGSLEVGQRVVLNDLLNNWLNIGYRASTVVEEPGHFSRRGGIGIRCAARE